MPFAAVGSAIAGGVASSVVGGLVNSATGQSASGAESAADPFASQRGQYQTMLQQLVSNPASVTSTPGYQFDLQQGEAAVNGGEAAAGYLNSGNRGTALTTFGQNLASSTYQTQFNDLAELAGANYGSPSTAANIEAQQATANQNAASSIGSSVSNAFKQYLNNGSSNATSGNFSNAFSGSGSSGYSSNPTTSAWSDFSSGSSGGATFSGW